MDTHKHFYDENLKCTVPGCSKTLEPPKGKGVSLDFPKKKVKDGRDIYYHLIVMRKKLIDDTDCAIEAIDRILREMLPK